ncbi:MAG TPA: PAS domain-containing protein [Rubrivivax sp.]|nr:PAS domain-containing protein [Rubrivivax sp.]
MSDPASIWHDAPCAALELWRDAGRVHWRLNRAAVEWSVEHGVEEAGWRALAGALLAGDAPPPQGRTRLGRQALCWRSVALSRGWLLWLTPQALPRAPHSGEPHAAADKLALMQGFGRVGFVERDTRSGRGWWDPLVYRITGLEPALAPPSFEQALRLVHPDDRDKLKRHHEQSMLQAGRYQTRCRLLLPDGRQRDLQWLTEVRNGADGRPARMLGVVVDDTESAGRVRTQQAVSAQLARALELAKVSVWRIDLQQRRIHFNDAGWRLAGVLPQPDGMPLDEMRGRVHPEDLPIAERAIERASSGSGVVDAETRVRGPGGGYRHVLTRRVAERDAQGRVVALSGVLLDQTEHVAERRRAQTLAQRLQLIADAAGVGVWRVENPGQADAERVEWNAQMFLIYGLNAAEAPPPVREWMHERLHPDDRERVTCERRRVPRSEQAGFETSFRVLRSDGSPRWVVCRSHRDERDGRTVLHGIHLDVTQQHALGQALQLQEQRLRLATQIAGVGIWDQDIDTGTVVWEEQMYRLRGLAPDDARTPRQIDEQIVPAESLAERRRLIRRHLEDSAPYACEFEVHWPDGSRRWLTSTGCAVRDEQGRARRMVGLNWDVTQRRLAEAALRDVEAAERASRAKSEFLSRMSHELRTPLNAMLGFAQLLARDAADRLDAPQRERLSRIHSAGTHLLALIDEVLDLSAVEAGSLPVALQPVELDPLLDEVRQWVAPMAAEREVSLRAADGGARVMADQRRLRQVLANLLSNAIKYNRRGGRVTTASRRLLVDGVPGWELSVRDTGRGLSAEQQAHLYEPFNRLGAEREGIEGRGIGLMTVHHLVQLMGGRLRLSSRSGEGSDFLVWLPAAQDEKAATAATAAAPGGASEAAPLSMLYIEDNPVNAMLVQEMVTLRPNITLHVAADGRRGVDAALARRPDLVLVDMQLPDMDGHEVLRRLRAQAFGSRVVALSANAMPDAAARARAGGFDDYWTKPIDIGGFLASLDRLAASCRTCSPSPSPSP